MSDSDSANYVHCNASVKAYLAYCCMDEQATIETVAQSILMCSQQGRTTRLHPVEIMIRNPSLDQADPRDHLRLRMCELYPKYADFVRFASRYATIMSYNSDIQVLTDPKTKFKFLN